MFSKWTPPLPLDFPDRAGRGHSLGELADFLSSDTLLTLFSHSFTSLICSKAAKNNQGLLVFWLLLFAFFPPVLL